MKKITPEGTKKVHSNGTEWIKKNGKWEYLKNPREKKVKYPYWNFWKVVFAGWLIRYPRQCFTIFGGIVGFLFVLIYNAVN